MSFESKFEMDQLSDCSAAGQQGATESILLFTCEKKVFISLSSDGQRQKGHHKAVSQMEITCRLTCHTHKHQLAYMW